MERKDAFYGFTGRLGISKESRQWMLPKLKTKRKEAGGGRRSTLPMTYYRMCNVSEGTPGGIQSIRSNCHREFPS